MIPKHSGRVAGVSTGELGMVQVRWTALKWKTVL